MIYTICYLGSSFNYGSGLRVTVDSETTCLNLIRRWQKPYLDRIKHFNEDVVSTLVGAQACSIAHLHLHPVLMSLQPTPLGLPSVPHILAYNVIYQTECDRANKSSPHSGKIKFDSSPKCWSDMHTTCPPAKTWTRSNGIAASAG